VKKEHLIVVANGNRRMHLYDKTRKQSYPAGTSAKAMLFARWRHHIHFASGFLMPLLTQL